jgi:poly-gamma-glutamate capsule biosynthesis protein CapA/YwtB (metallophosphatase superfamily)
MGGVVGSDSVVVCAVGDVMVDRPEPVTAFALSRDALRAADITFGNCESTYSTRGTRHPMTRGEVRADPRNVDALVDAGFDVMSFANNHHMDSGDDAFFDTLAELHGRGIATCGAGANLAEARLPAVIERKGTKVAFLGYSSILFPGYEADADRPGCAPLRVTTTYEQVEMEQPGSPPAIHTVPDADDLANLLDAVAAATRIADVVIVTPHWGLHFTPVVVADYESVVARAAIDAGADLVLGHHQHILKPVEVYDGKVIFHGLGNFAMDVNMGKHSASPHIREMVDQYPGYAVAHRPDYPTYPFHPLARQTMIARCRIRDGRIDEVSFVPCYINPLGQPEALTATNPRFAEVASYVQSITSEAGFDVGFKADEHEVRVLI